MLKIWIYVILQSHCCCVIIGGGFAWWNIYIDSAFTICRLLQLSLAPNATLWTSLQNDLYCVEWDVKLYYTIPFGWAIFKHVSLPRLYCRLHNEHSNR